MGNKKRNILNKKNGILIEKNDTFIVKIEDIGNDGEGIGKIDGYTLFIKDAVIGDVVRCKIMKAKKNYAYAKLEEVVEPSDIRVKPLCRYHRQCGGCQIQAMDYQAQLAYKQRKVKNNLIRIGGFDEGLAERIMEPIVGMENAYHYRNKAQFPVGTDQEGNLIAGFYAGRTHNIIANTDCALGIEENREILENILGHMRKYHIPAYDERTGTGLVRHILIRKGFVSGEIMVCLVVNYDEESERRREKAGKEQIFFPSQQKLLKRLAEIQGMTSVSVSINTDRTNVIMGNRIYTIWGKDKIRDTIHMRNTGDFSYMGRGIVFHISPLSFYQINPIQTEKLYSLAMEYAGLTGEETVWDLYCGIGTISLFLAGKAKKVYGVEAVPQAIRDARENAVYNGIENAEFFVGKAEEVLPEKYEKEGIRADVIVVDPPRKGCDRACLETMLRMRPERIVYVSCDPATLARDLRVLCDGGYELKRVRAVDQFGGTVHVETCVLLTHKRPTSYIEVTMDYDKIVPNQKPGRATYKMITEYVKEKYDLVVKSTTIAEVKRSLGFEVGDYSVKAEKTNYRKEKVTPEKIDAIKDAMRHFGVIE